MTAERLKRQFNVDASDLHFKQADNGLYEVATVGPYAVYLEDGNYTVAYNNSVCQWRHDLSIYLTKEN